MAHRVKGDGTGIDVRGEVTRGYTGPARSSPDPGLGLRGLHRRPGGYQHHRRESLIPGHHTSVTRWRIACPGVELSPGLPVPRPGVVDHLSGSEPPSVHHHHMHNRVVGHGCVESTWWAGARMRERPTVVVPEPGVVVVVDTSEQQHLPRRREVREGIAKARHRTRGAGFMRRDSWAGRGWN